MVLYRYLQFVFMNLSLCEVFTLRLRSLSISLAVISVRVRHIKYYVIFLTFVTV